MLFSTAVYAEQGQTREIHQGVSVNLDGQLMSFDEDSTPFIVDDRTFVPYVALRAMAETLGMAVEFDVHTNTVYLVSQVDTTQSGGLLNGMLVHDNIERHFHYFLPSNFEVGMPLLISLHGMGSNSLGSLDNTQWHTKAEQEGFVVVAPNSTRVILDDAGNVVDVVSDGMSSYDDPTLVQSHIAWNAGHFAATGTLTYVDDVGYIDALIDYFIEQYGVDSDKIFAAGMSNGGFFAQKLAVRLGDRFAAVASVTGPLGGQIMDETPVAPTRMVLFMADDDPVVLFDGLVNDGVVVYLSTHETTEFWLEHFRIDGEPVVTYVPQVPGDPTRIVRHEFPPGAGEFILYIIEDGGHAWPGGGQYLPVQFIGVASEVDATELIWLDFMKVFD